MGINKSPTINGVTGLLSKDSLSYNFSYLPRMQRLRFQKQRWPDWPKSGKKKQFQIRTKDSCLLLEDVLANGESVVESEDAIAPLPVEEPVEEVEDDDENDDDADDEEIPFVHYSRSRRAVKRPFIYL
jgi:hypothetical protein